MALQWTGPSLKTRSRELRLGRELALRAMYSADLGDFEPQIAWLRCQTSFFSEEWRAAQHTDDDEHPWADLSPTTMETSQEIGRAMLFAFWDNRSQIDGIIRGSSKRWKLNRMLPIERNILRLGTFELLTHVIPSRDVIYDCVELAKIF
ncbi:MAG: transcription antitermination factor NusB, partial [Myxococcota bacterium]